MKAQQKENFSPFFGIGVIGIKKKYVGKRQPKVKKHRGRPALVILIVLVVLMAAAVGAGYYLQHGNMIYPNVSMFGVNVGGMSRGEAEAAVADAVEEALGQKDFTLTLPDRTLTLEADKLNVSLDMEKALGKAMLYGREGNILSCILSWFDCRNTSYDVDISDAFLMDEDYILSQAQEVLKQVETTRQDSSLHYDEQSKKLTVTVGVSGVTFQPENVVQQVKTAYSKGNFDGARFDYDVTLYNPVDLNAFYRENCWMVKNAEYDEETRTVTKEAAGFGFDLEAAQQQVNMAAEGETLVFQLQEQKPTVYADTLYKALFGGLLYEYYSPHTVNWARTRNLELACEAIDGTILNPDEVFSFNGVVGERTAAKGYQPATIFAAGGVSEAGLGGGVCQVASTMYVVALYTDMEIVERTPHMFVVDYVPMGMDAGIFWDSKQDFRFRNTTGSPLLIRAEVKDNFVHIAYYGVSDKDYTVDMSYKILKTYPWKDVYTLDNTKPVGYSQVTVTPYTGYYVVTYKALIDKDGKQISSQVEAYSSYTKRDRQITIGPEPAPEPDPDPVEPTPDPNTSVTPADPSTPAPEPGEDTPILPTDPEPTDPTTPVEPAPTPAEPTPA